ncbi:MAG: response regulator transcription factor [Bacteroidetes bacterium]|nr:response regulator transcription factor [Bacteroidota bacterium]MBS1648911.1 response regulator transcription factor [Bacteroidota bacterium]
MINILIADDHQLVIDGIISTLASEKQYAIISQANNGQVALNEIAANPNKFDLIITDISMPLMSGIDLCKIIKEEYPQIKVLILSMYNSQTVVKEAITAEADGYILKHAGKEELLMALHRIINNGTYFSQDILPIIYNQYKREKEQEKILALLSTRETQILSLIVKEYTSEEIGQQLFISKKTVDNHRTHILEKTGCKTTIGLVKYAIKNGIMEEY